MTEPTAPEIAPDALHFVPLGGAGEIGMNLNLYACQGKWLMVDLGITFPGDSLPGVDVVMPDPAFIEERRADLLALVLTHAHEDHLGAVAYLWPRLRCPVYATPFAAAILRGKLEEASLLDEVPLIEVPLAGTLALGPFGLSFVSLTHSIPEPNALVIRTPFGTVFHTGDWKIDPDPLVGDDFDVDAVRRAGEGGVLALIGDSTNATVEGESGSEAGVRDKLTELIANCPHGVAVTLFASNIARLASIAEAAHANGREPVLVGRALKRFARAAQETGYLDSGLRLLNEEAGAALHREQAVYLCTGCQGEPRAAMARIAGDSHPRIRLAAGDMVIFSSKIIPGNERPIGLMHNRLVARGIEVITEKESAVHVSGHPCRGELRQMYQWVRPQIAVPVHGETRHMIAHAALADALQVPTTVLVKNGDVLRLAPGAAEITGHARAGRLVLDGAALMPAEHDAIRVRRKLMYDGVVVVTLVADRTGRIIAPPQIVLSGVGGDTDDAEAMLAEAVEDAIDRLPRARSREEGPVQEAVRLAVRRAIVKSRGKRPVIEVKMVEVAV